MRNKSILILITFLSLICILSISNVSAADFNGGSLTGLNESIQNNYDGIVDINRDIIVDSSDSARFNNSAINIDKDIIINGNNHVIHVGGSEIQLFNISDGNYNVTIKNLVIDSLQSKINNSAIVVNSHAYLTLENVTFINSNTYYLIYNTGNVVINNCNFISSFSREGIYSTNALSSITITNSNFESNYGNLINIDQGTFAMSNTHFIRNYDFLISFHIARVAIMSNCLFESNHFTREINNAMSYLTVNNCIFVNNTVDNNGIFSTIMDTYLNNNIFIGNQFSRFLICEESRNTLHLNGNYFGTNTPVEDEVIITNQVIDTSNTVFVQIGGGEEVNLSDLKIGESVNLTINYIGSGCENLEAIATNIIFNPIHAIVNQTSIILSSNPISFTLTPTRSGNYSLLLDSGYLNPIAKINLNNEYIILKNYTFTLDYNDNLEHGDVLSIDFVLMDDLGNPVTGFVNLKVGEDSYNVDIVNGKGHIEVTGLNAGQYVINATYFTSDYFYSDANFLSNLQISKTTPIIEIIMDETVAGQDKVIIVKLPSDATNRVQIVINSLFNQGGFVQLENGQATYTFTGLTVGTKSLYVYYTGDDNYYSTERSVTFYVSPILPDTPVTPPDTPDVPGDPDVPDVPDTPDVPGVPDVPDVPGVPDTPDVPGDPDVPDVPDTPDVPGVPDVPDVPGVPDTPDVPGVPDTPDVPGVPDVPVTPDIPNNPNIPDSPQNTNSSNNNQTTTNEGNLDRESTTSSDNINANVNSENQNVQVGSTANNAVSRASSQSSSAGEESSTAHELNRKSVTRDIGSSNYLISGIIIAVIALLLFIIGYKTRRNDDS